MPVSDKTKKKSINAGMNVSKDGKAAISKDEGFSAYPYDDQGKHCTVGTGILLSADPCTPQQKSTKYDVDQLNQTFHSRLHEAEGYVRHYVKDSSLTQDQFDALTSFVFNVGVGNAQETLSLANSGDHKEVADEMSKYVNVKTKDKNGKVDTTKAAGLITRRVRESTPFSSTESGAK
jgi:lysozyme